MGVTNILDLNNRIDALEKSFHELKIWTTLPTTRTANKK